MKKLFSFLSENKNLNYLLICAFSIAAFTYLNFDINNQFFFRDNIQRTFIYLTGIALITGLSCLFMKNISIIKIKLAALVANILFIPLFMIFIDNAEILNLPKKKSIKWINFSYVIFLTFIVSCYYLFLNIVNYFVSDLLIQTYQLNFEILTKPFFELSNSFFHQIVVDKNILINNDILYRKFYPISRKTLSFRARILGLNKL